MRCVALGLSLLAGSGVSRAHAEPNRAERLWSGNHAPTLPRGRMEVGVFQNAHYGVTDRVELALHPAWFFVLPHLELKALATQSGRWSLAARGRLAYPTLFLKLVSREGAGGLLPAKSSPPQALQIEGEMLGSVVWAPQQIASAALGLAVAPHAAFTPQELPLLDFPLLYPRFAPLYAVLVPRMQLAFEGRLWRGLHYDLSALAYLMPKLPDVGTTYALEQAAELQYRLGERVCGSLGLRVSEADYAFGFRVHFLPFADVRVGF